MNIFFIESTVEEIALSLDDKRLFKQAVECAQMLGTACSKNDSPVYKKDGFILARAHERHPMTVWVGLCQANYLFALDLAHACLTEHARRFGHDNLEYYDIYTTLPQLAERVSLFPNIDREYYPLCMPEYIWQKAGDKFTKDFKKAVIAYRIYWKLHKAGGKYTNSSPPYWLNDTKLMADVRLPDKSN